MVINRSLSLTIFKWDPVLLLIIYDLQWHGINKQCSNYKKQHFRHTL